MDVLRHAEEEPTSFASHRRLRVAVVPLGGVPDKRFRSYLSLLQRSFSVLPMANLSKPGSWRKEDSPFKYFSWFDGSLSLQYLDRAPPLSAAAPEWQDYQAFRRTWAVIGIVHLPSCAPGVIDGIEGEFQERLRDFPHAVAKKVFCFGYSFGATPSTGVEGGKDGEGGSEVEKESFENHYRNKEELVIFPPEGDHRDSGMSMVELHMGVILNDVAVVVLSHLEEEVNRMRAGGGTSSSSGSSSSSSGSSSSMSGKTLAKRGGQWLAGFRSPFDDDPSPAAAAAATTARSTTTTNTSNNNNNSNSSVPTGIDGSRGRINKWVGDICLLAGTPQDALEAYTQAIAPPSFTHPRSRGNLPLARA